MFKHNDRRPIYPWVEITAKPPWDPDASFNQERILQKYLGSSLVSAPELELPRGRTAVALCAVQAAGMFCQYVTSMAQVADDHLAAGEEPKSLETAVRFAELLKPFGESARSILAPDRVTEFALGASAPVQQLGQVYDSAHAAAGELLPRLDDIWKLILRQVSTCCPEHTVPATLRSFAVAVQEKYPLDFAMLFWKIKREHGAVCERFLAAADPPSASPANRAHRGARWSPSFQRSELADFFGETLKTLDRYLTEAGIRTRRQTRERWLVDLKSLDGDTAARLVSTAPQRKLKRTRAN